MRCYLETYGCTANKYDELHIKAILQNHNHIIVTQPEQADLLILLTCTVIDTTEQKMLSRIKTFKQSGKTIIIAGCMADIQKQLIQKHLPNALLLPPHQIPHLPHILQPVHKTDSTMNNNPLLKPFEHITAPIAIAEGCLYHCSYCITHFARGNLKSRTPDEILFDAQHALQQGCKELQITAQDTASYGMDHHNKTLPSLLKQLCDLPDEFRIRVGMMNPATLNHILPELTEMYKHPKIYKFLHLPLQSGDNQILQQMNRQYTIENYLEMTTTFRTKIPHLTIATDIIVGFPGETEQQFTNTLTNIKKIKPDIVNITRFSPRPLTPAKKMKHKTPTHIMKQRSKKLTELSQHITLKQNQKQIGIKHTILITEQGKNNTVVGRNNSNKPVVLHTQIPLGTFVNTQIVDAQPTHLFGKLI